MKKLLGFCIIVMLFGCMQKQNTEKGTQAEPSADNRIPIIFDTDANNELDDQHALAYLFSNTEVFDIKAVTTNATPSGGEIQNHTMEARRIIQLFNLEDKVPLLEGANANFTEIKDQINEPHFDGDQAVNFIIEEAQKYSDNELLLLPVGKLTNIALALKKEPGIQKNVKIVWLGSNYPEPGEYNQDSDTAAMNFILALDVPFEMVTVRYGRSSGTAAVSVIKDEVASKMPGLGPIAEQAVKGRHGGEFKTFGDYAMSLFEHAEFYGNPPHRSLFDMAAVAIVKNPDLAEKQEVSAPRLVDNTWVEQPQNARKIIVWENFKRDDIMEDFYSSLKNSANKSEK